VCQIVLSCGTNDLGQIALQCLELDLLQLSFAVSGFGLLQLGWTWFATAELGWHHSSCAGSHVFCCGSGYVTIPFLPQRHTLCSQLVLCATTGAQMVVRLDFPTECCSAMPLIWYNTRLCFHIFSVHVAPVHAQSRLFCVDTDCALQPVGCLVAHQVTVICNKANMLTER
jgi:hypothetical protein